MDGSSSLHPIPRTTTEAVSRPRAKFMGAPAAPLFLFCLLPEAHSRRIATSMGSLIGVKDLNCIYF